MAELLDGAVGWPPESAERYRQAGYWTGTTFGALLRERARADPDALAVVDGNERWTYAELDARSDDAAAGFARLGIGPRDRVVVALPNVAAFVSIFFGLARLGAVPVMALPAHRRSELTHFCRLTDAAALVVPDTHAGYDHLALAREVCADVPELRHLVVVGEPAEFTGFADLTASTDPPPEHPEPDASDIALMQLSGGSTGIPKLIPRTHDDYLYSVRRSAEICELGPHSVYLVALPVAHNFPLSSPGILGVVWAGGTIVLAPDPGPDTAFALIAEHGVTITGLVPPLAMLWLAATRRPDCPDLSSLQVLQVGGAKLAYEAARQIEPAFGCTLQQVFGMAEGLVNYTRLDDPDDVRTRTQGSPMSDADEVRVVDDTDRDVAPGELGHLLTRGPYTIRGYYRAQEHNRDAFTADGYYRTGDLVRRTPDGNLAVEGRAKEQINRGGEKIAPAEIENILLTHPGVHDAVLVPIPDPYLGERTCAAVVPAGDPPPKSAELRAFVRAAGVADYKVPDRVEIVAAFPTTGVGKISRQLLRRRLAEELTERLRPAPRTP